MIFIATDILNPYKRDILSQNHYETLIDFLVEQFPDGFTRPTDISVNGHEVALADYDIELKEGDVIVLLDRAALPVGLIGGWFITALANLAISVTLSYVANKLFAPDAPQDQGTPSSVYNLNSAQNAARYGSPIPIIYGKVRMFPSMIVQPYYKFEDNIEYLYHVLCIGQGTNTASEVLIGDDVITNADDFQYKFLYQDSFYNIPAKAYGVHLSKTLSVPSTMEIKGDGGALGVESEKYTISADAAKIEFDYMYPNGLFYVKSDGSYYPTSSSFVFRLYTLSGTTYTEVFSTELLDNNMTIDAIQKTYTKDISSYNEPVYASFQRKSYYYHPRDTHDLYIKRVKEIYPNENFTQRYGDITLLACKIKATNTISAAGQLKINGYFTRTDVGNKMHEVLTDIYTNTNYGGGLSADDLSFPTTTETVNCAYDTNMTIFDAMRRPALAQGFSLYLAGMDVILKKDGKNNIINGMYNEMNILRNSFKAQYLFKEEYAPNDGFEVTYIDGDGWIQRAEKYPSTSTRPQRVDLFGVVDYGQVDEPAAVADGWYQIKLNSDTYGDYDITTITSIVGEYFGTPPFKHTIDSNLDLQTIGWLLSGWFKSRVQDTQTIYADCDLTDMTDANYRCEVRFNKASRTWTRIDNSDYYLHPLGGGSYSHSLGVCANDPRFLVDVTSDTNSINDSGIHDKFPKFGYIWLFAGEKIRNI